MKKPARAQPSCSSTSSRAIIAAGSRSCAISRAAIAASRITRAAIRPPTSRRSSSATRRRAPATTSAACSMRSASSARSADARAGHGARRSYLRPRPGARPAAGEEPARLRRFRAPLLGAFGAGLGEHHARLPGAAAVAVRAGGGNGAHRRAGADRGGRRRRRLARGLASHEAHHPYGGAGRPAQERARAQHGRAGGVQPLAGGFLPSGRSRPLDAPRPGGETAFHLRSGRQTMSLKVEKQASVGWIVFDNPQRRNAINGAMWRGIPEAMARFDADREVRCIAFRGAGSEAFSAGADISEFDKARAERGSVAEYDDLLDRVLHSIQDSRKPCVAMIHGFCLGGGLEVALACDLRYCGASAQFGIPAAKLGLAYNVEGHKRLLETVGHARAREIMFLGRRYSAAESLAMGLVHQVLPDAELENAVGEFLRILCENAPLSIANTKTIVEEYVKSSGAPDSGRMRAAIERCARSEDYKEGRRAFMEKRKPRFEGK